MSRIKLLLLSMLAVLVVGAVTSVSASAATTNLCPQTSGNTLPAICIQNAASELIAETGFFPFVSNKEPNTTSLLNVPGLGLDVICTVANNTGTFAQTVLATVALVVGLVIRFSTCHLEEIEEANKKCKVEEPIKTVGLDGTVGNEDANTLDVTFKPEIGTTFVELNFENNGAETCPALIFGKHPVKGEQLCLLLLAEQDLAVHLLECQPGTGLTVSGQPAEFDIIEEVSLGGANTYLPWSVQLV